ncbi:MAG: hypothetical protein GY835_08520 [bacterium]|nr:hypothetical protein [bacterium]
MLPVNPRAGRCGILSLAAVLLSLAISPTSSCAEPATEIRDGVTHVLNTSTSPGGLQTLEPRRLWEIGGESEEDEEMFGIVQTAMADADGNSYFLDTMLHEVRMFSPEGEYVRSLSRMGEGPGEFYNAMSAFLLADGRVAIVQIMPSNAVTVDIATGDAGENIPLPKAGMLFPHQMAPLGDNFVISYVQALNRDGEGVNDQILAVTDARGNEVAQLCLETIKLNEARAFTPTDRPRDFMENWRVGADGLIYLAADYLDYHIDCFAADGRKVRVIEREYEDLAKTDEELRKINAGYRHMGRDSAPARDMDPLFRCIETMVTRESGELWVLTARGRKSRREGMLGVFDVFDAAGHYIRQVEFPCDYNPDFDLWFISHDRLFILKEGRNTPTQTSTNGGVTFIRSGGPQMEDLRDDVQPFSIVCYELPY